MDTAIVLAAQGLGRKVWPYGEFRQKCTIPVANKPIVRRVVENLIEAGCPAHCCCGGASTRNRSAGHLPIYRTLFLLRSIPLDGTASAVLTAHEHLEDQPYLVVYGDIVTTAENLRNFMSAFRSGDVEAAALVQRLGNEDASDWLCAGIETSDIENGGVLKLNSIEGHPRGGSHRLCGVYAFENSATTYFLRNPGNRYTGSRRWHAATGIRNRAIFTTDGGRRKDCISSRDRGFFCRYR